MFSFIITFLLLYGGMHVYAFTRLKHSFAFGTWSTTILTVLMLIMTLTPLLVRLSESTGKDQIAQVLAWPGYTWMGWIFIFCSLLFVLDSLRCTFRIANHFARFPIPDFLNATFTCEAALLLSFVISAHALFEARTIHTERVTITTSKLPPHSGTLRIVQISDLHLGLLFGELRLENVLQTIRAAHPDILVSTGDLVDGRLSKENALNRLDRMAARISDIPTRGGKFAVVGNHEFYAGLNQALEFTGKAGFTILRNRTELLPEGIAISGVDDPARKRLGMSEPIPSEVDLLRAVSPQHFQVLLKHRPTVPEASDGHFDLQLSGHVHKGQIFPFNLLVRLMFPIPCGTSETRHQSKIHVSRGTGTWGPPMRLLAPPEVTLIDIKPAQ